MKPVTFFILFLLSCKILPAQEIVVPTALKHFVEQSFQRYPRVGDVSEVVRMNEVKVHLGKAGYLPVARGDLSYRRQYPTPSIQFPTGQ